MNNALYSEVGLFHTHHSPVGAWASLTFGSPRCGVSIDLQEPNVKDSGALLFGYIKAGQVHTLGFVNRLDENIDENEGDREKQKPQGAFSEWNVFQECEIGRVLTSSMDIYRAGDMKVTVYTPYGELEDPKVSEISELSCLPGILIDLEVDNSGSDTECEIFMGLAYSELKKISAFSDNHSCGLRFRNDWSFSARNEEDIFLVQGGDALEHLQKGEAFIHQNGPAFIARRIAPGEKKALTIAWTVYASQGSNGAMETTYYYQKFFAGLAEAEKGMLDNAEKLRMLSQQIDEEWRTAQIEPKRMSLLCQAIRGYYASSQLLMDKNKVIHWNTCEGAYLWRNTMDLCADHLPWELIRNPWVVRSMMDDYITKYAYKDEVIYPGKEGIYPGGIAFTHDMGCYFTYSEPGYSAYERSNSSIHGFYFYMTTEQLLNGIYCVSMYALKTGDYQWLRQYPTLLADFMESLENRDAATAAERNGILKAVSTRSGACEMESTTYDSMDPSLMKAGGSLYQLVKVWCSLLLLKQCAMELCEGEIAKRADTMLEKCRNSMDDFISVEQPWLKANLYSNVKSAVMAVAEPLAVPFMFDLLTKKQDSKLFELLRKHCLACLEEGDCIDSATGGLRLSSTSDITWTSKAALTLYVCENALEIEIPDSLERELIGWAQESAVDTTISDQIRVNTREVIGGMYYPRIVACAAWLTGRRRS